MINKLQLFQNRAACTALKCNYRTNIITMHEKLNWLLIKDRLLYSLIIFTRNIIVTKSPCILFRNLSFNTENHRYITRHVVLGNFTLPTARTNTTENTVIFRDRKEWNLLPNHIKLTLNVSHFKRLQTASIKMKRDLGLILFICI